MPDSLPKPLVLICDDEATIRCMVAAKLEAAGFRVVQGENGREGLELLAIETPACVVSDFQMPEMSGIELVERMRADPRWAELPVVLLTARAHLFDEAQARAMGITRTMAKPFSARELVAVVCQLVEATGESRARRAA